MTSTGWHILWPWIWVLAPLPLLLRLLVRRADPGALQISSRHLFAQVQPGTRRWSINWLVLFIWLLMLLAASRPQWIDEPVQPPAQARDLVLAIDISRSMSERDMRLGVRLLSRLDAVKTVVQDFIESRRGDRLALLLFGELPYWYVPLTYDLETLNELLQEAREGWAGDGTAIGDALLLAAEKLSEQSPEQRVIILLTDGASNRGAPVTQALRQLRNEQARVYTIGFGGTGQRFGQGGTAFDSVTLRKIAEQTNGRYFNASTPGELKQVYEEIDQLERQESESTPYYPITERFREPLLLCLLLALLSIAGSWLSEFFRARGSVHAPD